MPDVTDLQITTGVRRELSGRRVDLSKLKVAVAGGVVTLTGELAFVGIAKPQEDTSVEIKFLESCLRNFRGVKDIAFQFDNWIKNDSGKWELKGGAFSGHPSVAHSGEGLHCPSCKTVVRFCPCCGEPLVPGVGEHSRMAVGARPMIKSLPRKPELVRPPVKSQSTVKLEIRKPEGSPGVITSREERPAGSSPILPIRPPAPTGESKITPLPSRPPFSPLGQGVPPKPILPLKPLPTEKKPDGPSRPDFGTPPIGLRPVVPAGKPVVPPLKPVVPPMKVPFSAPVPEGLSETPVESPPFERPVPAAFPSQENAEPVHSPSVSEGVPASPHGEPESEAIPFKTSMPHSPVSEPPASGTDPEKSSPERVTPVLSPLKTEPLIPLKRPGVTPKTPTMPPLPPDDFSDLDLGLGPKPEPKPISKPEPRPVSPVPPPESPTKGGADMLLDDSFEDLLPPLKPGTGPGSVPQKSMGGKPGMASRPAPAATAKPKEGDLADLSIDLDEGLLPPLKPGVDAKASGAKPLGKLPAKPALPQPSTEDDDLLPPMKPKTGGGGSGTPASDGADDDLQSLLPPLKGKPPATAPGAKGPTGKSPATAGGDTLDLDNPFSLLFDDTPLPPPKPGAKPGAPPAPKPAGKTPSGGKDGLDDLANVDFGLLDLFQPGGQPEAAPKPAPGAKPLGKAPAKPAAAEPAGGDPLGLDNIFDLDAPVPDTKPKVGGKKNPDPQGSGDVDFKKFKL